jgi:hypothetical protein
MPLISTDPLDEAELVLSTHAAGPFCTDQARQRAREALEAFRRMRRREERFQEALVASQAEAHKLWAKVERQER